MPWGRKGFTIKISSKGRYSINILLELSLESDELLTARELSDKQNISIKYTEQIMSVLNKAGFVKSQRGSTGGYRLQFKPEEIIVGDVLRVTESSFSIDYDKDSDDPDKSEHPAVRNIWRKSQMAIRAVVDNITFADLVVETLELKEKS